MNRIKELREAAQLSMSDVSKKLGIPYTTYVNYEKCTREPNSEMLIAIADLFEVSIDYLLCRSNNKEKILISHYLESLSPDAVCLIDNYNKLNTSGKEKASDYVEDLTTIDKYTAAEQLKSKLG